jgi:hypothetical protein
MALVISGPPTNIEIVEGKSLTPGWLSWFANFFGVPTWRNDFFPAVTPSGAMTASGVAGTFQYLRIGPLVFFYLGISMTLGGTPSDHVTFSLPLAPVTVNAMPCAGAITTPSGTFSPAFFQANGGALLAYLSPVATFAAGANTFYVSGFYRCA